MIGIDGFMAYVQKESDMRTTAPVIEPPVIEPPVLEPPVLPMPEPFVPPKPMPGTLLITFKEGAKKKEVMEKLKLFWVVKSTQLLEGLGIGMVDVSDISCALLRLKDVEGVASVEKDEPVSISPLTPGKLILTFTEGADKRDVMEKLKRLPMVRDTFLLEASGIGMVDVSDVRHAEKALATIEGVATIEEDGTVHVSPIPDGSARKRPAKETSVAPLRKRPAAAAKVPGKLMLTFKEGSDKKEVMESVKKVRKVRNTELLEGVGIGMVDVTDVASAELALKAIPGVETVEKDSTVSIAPLMPGKLIITFEEDAAKKDIIKKMKHLPTVKSAQLLEGIGIATVDVSDVTFAETALKDIKGVATIEKDTEVRIAPADSRPSFAGSVRKRALKRAAAFMLGGRAKKRKGGSHGAVAGKLLITFKAGADKKSLMSKVERLDFVSSTQLLESVGIGMADVSDIFAVEEALKSMKGVETVERDGEVHIAKPGRLMLTFKEGVDKKSVMDSIKALAMVSSTQLLESTGIGIVDVSDIVAAELALGLIAGVATVEKDGEVRICALQPGKLMLTFQEGADQKKIMKKIKALPTVKKTQLLESVGIGMVDASDVFGAEKVLKTIKGVETVERDGVVRIATPGKLILTFEEGVDTKEIMEKVKTLQTVSSSQLLEGLGIGIVDVSDVSYAELGLKVIGGVKTVEKDSEARICALQPGHLMITFKAGVDKKDVMKMVKSLPMVSRTQLLQSVGIAMVDVCDIFGAEKALKDVEGVDTVERDGVVRIAAPGKLMLTFEEGIDKTDVMEKVRMLPMVSSIQLLDSIGIGMADVSDITSATSALQLMEGVKTIEKDSTVRIAMPGTLMLTFKAGVDKKDVMEKVETLAMVSSTQLLEGIGIGMVDVKDMVGAESALMAMEGVETVERDSTVHIAAQAKPGKLMLTFETGVDMEAVMEKVQTLAMVSSTQLLECAGIGMVDVSDMHSAESVLKTLPGVATVEKDEEVHIATPGKLLLTFKEGVDETDVMEKVKLLPMVVRTQLLASIGIGMVDVSDIIGAEDACKHIEGLETIERDGEARIA